jgi:uncharacterized protein
VKTEIFFSQGARLTATLYPPAGSGPHPAVLITGSWLTVKEQMPARYAPLLAEAGFLAVTFDFHGFGASAGEPREVESPWRKAEDLRNAAAFLSGHPLVDRGRVGILPICASAGYAALAAAGEPGDPDRRLIRSIAMVAPWLHDAGIVRAVYGGDAGVRRRLGEATAARLRYAGTGTVDYVAAASNTDETAAMYAPGDVFAYYLDPARGKVPSWGGRFAVMAWTDWLTFDPIALATRVDVPVRVVTSEASATPGGARAFLAGLRAPHDEVWMAGTQFDFYDDPRTVAAAAGHAAEHLRATLAVRS